HANPPDRPHIDGIAGVRIYVTDMNSSRLFYSAVTNTKRDCDWCETQEPSAFRLPSGQFLLLTHMVVKDGISRIAEISFNADNLKELAHVFKENKIRYEADVEDGVFMMIRVADPESNLIAFFDKDAPRQFKAYYPNADSNAALKERILHVGFVVKNREAMDHFYKDILGFRLYWQGGSAESQTDWVDMQVPDGTDWIEYMLNVPAGADQQTLGKMNHISFGVADVRKAGGQLMESRLNLRITEEPKIARDGKWQLNLYDPDQTRIELLEFTPVEKPCCADYTSPYPAPQ
ncbi:MAG: VOC family protein, partial [Candidatus Acidiferrum sp.]